MLDNDEYSKKPPCIGERYAVAAGASNTRVATHPDIRSSGGDMVLAAGMSKYRMGMALRRLMTEWDSCAKPVPMDAAAVERLAQTYKREPLFLDSANKVKNPNGGRVFVPSSKPRDLPEYVIPLMLAKRESEAWHAHELGLLLQRLKTMPLVRDGLTHHAEELGIENAAHVAASVLMWWLNPLCPVCQGRKLKVIAGTGRTGSKNCGKCKGAGESKIPHGSTGGRLIGYIKFCLRQSAADLRSRFQRGRTMA